MAIAAMVQSKGQYWRSGEDRGCWSVVMIQGKGRNTARKPSKRSMTSIFQINMHGLGATICRSSYGIGDEAGGVGQQDGPSQAAMA